MSNQKPDQSPPAPPLASALRASASGKHNEACDGLRASIRRLQGELAERQAQARPMPSSVMRAYQKLIDRYFSELTDQSPENSDISKS